MIGFFRKKTSSQLNGIEVLESRNYGMIFGGGKNDCVCGSCNPRTGRMQVVGHHDIYSFLECYGICCYPTNFPGGFCTFNGTEVPCLEEELSLSGENSLDVPSRCDTMSINQKYLIKSKVQSKELRC